MWHSFAKDGLMVIFTISILLISPAMTLLFSDESLNGFLIFVLSCPLGIFSFCFAYYWHKRGIRSTVFGPAASLIVFIAGIATLRYYKLNSWIPVVILIMMITCGYLIGNNKRAEWIPSAD